MEVVDKVFVERHDLHLMRLKKNLVLVVSTIETKMKEKKEKLK